jgi:hypothetical protein
MLTQTKKITMITQEKGATITKEKVKKITTTTKKRKK